jgi:hypothetical protein
MYAEATGPQAVVEVPGDWPGIHALLPEFPNGRDTGTAGALARISLACGARHPGRAPAVPVG